MWRWRANQICRRWCIQHHWDCKFRLERGHGPLAHGKIIHGFTAIFSFEGSNTTMRGGTHPDNLCSLSIRDVKFTGATSLQWCRKALLTIKPPACLEHCNFSPDEGERSTSTDHNSYSLQNQNQSFHSVCKTVCKRSLTPIRNIRELKSRNI